MSSIKSSVVVCAFNEEKRLYECLNSIKSQINHLNTEILIVDNDSQDLTSEISKKFINENNNLKIQFLKIKHVPLTSSRNTAISFCRGEFIFFVDADAEVGEGWLDHMINEFDENTSIVAGNISILNTNSFFANFIFYSHFTNSLKQNRFIGANMGFKSSVFEKYGGFFAATKNRGDETLFLQNYMNKNPTESLVFAEKSIVFNEFPENLFVWLDQQYKGGKEYFQILKFGKASKMQKLKQALRPLNILFFPHLLIHYFLVYSPFFGFHLFLFLFRNAYKYKHCFFGAKNLFNRGKIFQSFLFLPVTFLGTFFIDLGYVIKALSSINKTLDQNHANVGEVIENIKSSKFG